MLGCDGCVLGCDGFVLGCDGFVLGCDGCVLGWIGWVEVIVKERVGILGNIGWMAEGLGE